jgi:hypothetical protein
MKIFNTLPMSVGYATQTPFEQIAKDLGVQRERCYIYANETEIVACQKAPDACPIDEIISIGYWSGEHHGFLRF